MSNKRKLVLSNSFKRAFKKHIKKNPHYKIKVEQTLREMEKVPIPEALKPHKLSGTLKGLFACSCGVDCRIIFAIKKNIDGEDILLIDIGTHDEVY